MHRLIARSSEDRTLFFGRAAELKGLPPWAIEKDFWVCWTLEQLFASSCGEHLAFKGGTSLSKAWGLINRFSEDIDLVLDRHALGMQNVGSTRSQIEKLRSKTREFLRGDLLSELLENFRAVLGTNTSWSLTIASLEDDPEGQTLLFAYPPALSSSDSYLKPLVRIEIVSRSDSEPNDVKLLRPYVFEEIPDTFPEGGVSVRTVLPTRTFVEKALLLHEERHRPTESPRKRSYARHYYDLHMLIEAGIAHDALKDNELFEKTLKHRGIFFKQNWMNYEDVKLSNFLITPAPHQYADWESEYEAMKKEMFYGDPPSFESVMNTVRTFEAWLAEKNAPASDPE